MKLKIIILIIKILFLLGAGCLEVIILIDLIRELIKQLSIR